MHIRFLAHNKYLENGSDYEYAQYCFPKSCHGLFFWQTSGEVVRSKTALSGQLYTGAGLYGPTLPLGHAPANLGQGVGWQLHRVNCSENQKQSVHLASSQGWPRETCHLHFSRSVVRGHTLSP